MAINRERHRQSLTCRRERALCSDTHICAMVQGKPSLRAGQAPGVMTSNILAVQIQRSAHLKQSNKRWTQEVAIPPIFPKAKCPPALNKLALPCARHSSEIALLGSRRLHNSLAVAPVLFAHDVVTKIEIGRIISSRTRMCLLEAIEHTLKRAGAVPAQYFAARADRC